MLCPFSATGGRMTASIRRFAALLGVVATLGLAAAPVKKIKFTDTKLKNGLRVIISEDHAAPVVLRRRQLQRRLARRAQGAHRLRAPLRAHDVQGLRERRSRRASRPHLHQRRDDERHDQQGSDAVLRDAAGQPARPGAVPRGRSHAVARHHQGATSTTSATRCRKSAASASTTSRTAGRSKPGTSWPTTTPPTSTR